MQLSRSGSFAVTLSAHWTQLIVFLGVLFSERSWFHSTLAWCFFFFFFYLSREINGTEWWSCGSFSTVMNRERSSQPRGPIRRLRVGGVIYVRITPAEPLVARRLCTVVWLVWLRENCSCSKFSLWIIKPRLSMWSNPPTPPSNEDTTSVTVLQTDLRSVSSKLFTKWLLCFLIGNTQQEECVSPQLICMGRQSSSLEPTQGSGRRRPWTWR